MSSWLSRYILRQSPVLGYRTRPPQNTKAVSIASLQSLDSKTVCWTQGSVWQDPTESNRFVGERKGISCGLVVKAHRASLRFSEAVAK